MSLWQRLINATGGMINQRKQEIDTKAKQNFLAQLDLWRQESERQDLMAASDQEILRLASIIGDYVKSTEINSRSSTISGESKLS